ncbi:MAG: hypothetical protein ACC618_03160 [Patescibacteria group bacterium]
MQTRIFLTASIIGYLLFYVLSHPNSTIHKKLPNIKIKWVQFLPSVTITISGKVIHIHHWLGFGLILMVSIFIESGILGSLFTKGILSGSIIQGIFTPKSLKLIYKKGD